MIYRFVMVSDEVPGFLREIRIDGTATFLELHRAILDSVGYSDDQITSFFTTDKQWRPKKEILLMDMGLHATDDEYYLMDDTYLDDFLEDEGDRVLYQFDQLGDRYFYLELKEVILGEQQDKPLCTRRKGEAPQQTSDVEELLVAEPKAKAIPQTPPVAHSHEELEEFDSDSFDISELDADGFDISGEEVSEE